MFETFCPTPHPPPKANQLCWVQIFASYHGRCFEIPIFLPHSSCCLQPSSSVFEKSTKNWIQIMTLNGMLYTTIKLCVEWENMELLRYTLTRWIQNFCRSMRIYTVVIMMQIFSRITCARNEARYCSEIVGTFWSNDSIVYINTMNGELIKLWKLLHRKNYAINWNEISVKCQLYSWQYELQSEQIWTCPGERGERLNSEFQVE